MALILPATPSVLAIPGDLDPTFGGDGKVTTDFAGSFAYGVAMQADGKIVAAGVAEVSGTDDFALARYNTDGSLDTTFDGDGKVTTDFAGSLDHAFAVVIQGDGKIVAAGRANVSGTDDDFALARYNTDGSLDTTFDGDGKVTTDFAGSLDHAFAVVIQGDGKIVAAGLLRLSLSGGFDFALARYNTDGSLDPTFGGDGRVTTDFAGSLDQAFGVAIQGDGKIVAAGLAEVLPGPSTALDFALARYNTDGSLDPTFGGDGRVTTDFAGRFDEARAVAIQGDGRIVAAGSARVPGGFDYGNDDFALARYNTDGSLDPTFGGDGRVTTHFTDVDDKAFGAVIQADGRIVAVGCVVCFIGTQSDFALARYNTDGSLDPTFGGDGLVTTDFAAGADQALGVAIQGDGKIVAAGWAVVSGGFDFALARYAVEGGVPSAHGTIRIVKDAVPDDSQDFRFSSSFGNFSLDDDGNEALSNSRSFLSVAPGTYEVVELGEAGWRLTSLVCEDPDGGSLALVPWRRATIDLDPGETVTCTFTNTQRPVVVGLGDSVAAGHGLGKSDGYPDNPQAYPAVLGRMLGWHSLNYAISGACAASHGGNGSDLRTPGGPSDPFNPNSCNKSILNNQLGQVAQVNPKVITMTVGANDIQFSECFRALIEGYEGIRAKDPCARPTLAQHLEALEVNLKVVIGRIKNRFPDAKVALTKYFNPLAPIAGGTNACVLYKVAAATKSPNLIAKPKAWESAARRAQTQAFVYGSKVLAKLNNTLERVAKVSGITIVPIDFSGHDMCAGQRAGSTAEAWVFAPTGDLFLSWSTGVSGGSEHVRIAITGRCPDETQDPPHISGSGSGKKGPFSWTYFYVVIINCSPHPTADGQASIAGAVRNVVNV